MIPTLGFRPTEALGVDLFWDMAWRDSTRDAVYGPPGVPLFPADATSARFIGHSLSMAAEWQIAEDLAASFAFTRFFAGDAVRDAGGEDLTYVALWLNLWF